MKRRFILLVSLLALFAFVATIEEQAEAADVATRVEGESFATKPAGYRIVSGAGYSGGAALKFTQDDTASQTINCSATCNVVLMASGGQSGGQPTFSVNGSPAQALISTTVTAYTFDINLPAGQNEIDVTAGNTGTGRNAVLDVVTFPASDGGGTDTDGDGKPDSLDNCPDDYNPGQRDDDGDGVGNKCDDGSTPPTDTDNDGVIDADDQCDTQPGPAPTGCPTDPGGGGSWNCTGKHIRPGVNDIDATINSDPPGTATTFCVHAGRYQVSAQAVLKTGDKFKGQPETGPPATVGPATKPDPPVELVGSGTGNLLRADGDGISISWVDLSGARGTGNGSGAIAAGSAGSDFLVEYVRIHNNDSLGISNMKGRIFHSEFFSNSEAGSSLGFNASAIKGITEYEAGHLYVHDEQGNGLWCDVGCSKDPNRLNGFWVHDSVVVDGDRAGIRYENSPNRALFANNEIHGNGKTEWRGGIDIRDSRNARVINNNLGPATIAGVSYQANGNRIGVRATDSGRSDRVDLAFIQVQNNKMNLDRIVTCGGQVTCSGNTNVGSR
jgi:hypothetical protein